MLLHQRYYLASETKNGPFWFDILQLTDFLDVKLKMNQIMIHIFKALESNNVINKNRDILKSYKFSAIRVKETNDVHAAGRFPRRRLRCQHSSFGSGNLPIN